MLYALVNSGTITGFHSPPDGSTIDASFTNAVSITGSIIPRIGWLESDGTFTPPTSSTPTPELTQSQQAQQLLRNGLTITSTSGNWTATFATLFDATGSSVWTLILSEQSALLMSSNQTFADGETTVHWPDITSTPETPSLHVMTPEQFQAFALAIGRFVAQCRNVMNGVPSAVLPQNTATIP